MRPCAYLLAIPNVATSDHDVALPRALIALECVYVAAVTATWSPVGLMVPNESTGLSIRAKAMSLLAAVQW